MVNMKNSFHGQDEIEKSLYLLLRSEGAVPCAAGADLSSLISFSIPEICDKSEPMLDRNDAVSESRSSSTRVHLDRKRCKNKVEKRI